MSNSIFIKTIKGEQCERPPVWFMRQAGRVLPSYMALREQYTFQELMQDPALTAKVSLLPVHDLGVDAAILFSDILVIPEALGMKLNFTDHGPVFDSPIKGDAENISRLHAKPEKLNHIYEAIELIRDQKPADIALIGFCGAPFTTFCYMVQGHSTNHTFDQAIHMIYNDPASAHKLFEVITELSVEYAVSQVKHGIDAFQLFETHAGLLPYELYLDLVMPYVKKITRAVQDAGCPVIFFPKGLSPGMKMIDRNTTDFLGVDWQNSLFNCREIIDPNIGLQGNLDPRIFSTHRFETVVSSLEKLIPFGQKNHKWIFNTGHGLSPDNRFEHVKSTVDWIKTTDWKR